MASNLIACDGGTASTPDISCENQAVWTAPAGPGVSFVSPSATAVDSHDNIYVADAMNNTIRKITPAGITSTLAGTAGCWGSNDGAGTVARFRDPNGIAVDPSGNVYVVDSSNNKIRKITPAGVVSTFAGSELAAGSLDGAGEGAEFFEPGGVALDVAGNAYVTNAGDGHSPGSVRKISPEGVVTTLASGFNSPGGIAVDTKGTVYITEAFSKIDKITPAGVMTTLLGAGIISSDYDAGEAPRGLAVDKRGNIYVADQRNERVLKITPDGDVRALAGSPYEVNFTTVWGGGVFNGGLNPNNCQSADGQGSSARFCWPSGVALDSSDNVYVADMFNNTVRKITPDGAVTTVAGTAGVRGSTNGFALRAKTQR